MSAKKPGTDMSRNGKPANLPGFLVELMGPHLQGFGLRYGGRSSKSSMTRTVGSGAPGERLNVDLTPESENAIHATLFDYPSMPSTEIS